MRSEAGGSGGLLLAAFLALLAAFGATGCGLLSTAGPVEEGVIEPATPAGTSHDLNLGPGVRPLSLGPGDKSSPRISPSGERLAFVLDGYVADKALYTRDLRRRTATDLSATNAEWISEEDLAVLGTSTREDSGAQGASSLFVVSPVDPPGTSKLADGVRATGVTGDSVVAAVETSGGYTPSTTLLRIREGGDAVRRFPLDLRGRVSGLSVSPDGREAVLAVRIGEDAGGVEISTYRFSDGTLRRAALLDEGLEVVGAPQWTTEGIYFVAGEDDDEADYALYQVPAGSGEYEPARGPGEDFVPASIAVSPDGGNLAILGRRNSRSPTDLYLLDLASKSLEAVTANENMEIKTKPSDLAWSPDGSYVLVVARGNLSGPKVYGSPAEDLSSAFYNVYGVPVGTPSRATGGRAG